MQTNVLILGFVVFLEAIFLENPFPLRLPNFIIIALFYSIPNAMSHAQFQLPYSSLSGFYTDQHGENILSLFSIPFYLNYEILFLVNKSKKMQTKDFAKDLMYYFDFKSNSSL